MSRHLWKPREYARFEACPAHAGALSRMPFERALAHADDCSDCDVQWSEEEDED